MKKIAVFPGSFDPITKGHESIVLRAAPLFDELIVAIGINADKEGFFPLKQRISWIEKTFQDYPNIKVMKYQGLTVDFCKEIGALYILRGLRTSADFEFERSIGQINKQLDQTNEIETVFLLSEMEHTPLNSSIVRSVFQVGGNVSHFIPNAIDLSTYKKDL